MVWTYGTERQGVKQDVGRLAFLDSEGEAAL